MSRCHFATKTRKHERIHVLSDSCFDASPAERFELARKSQPLTLYLSIGSGWNHVDWPKPRSKPASTPRHSRYYERARGLLPRPHRRGSGYREYSADAVSVVRFIKRAQGALGFPSTKSRNWSGCAASSAGSASGFASSRSGRSGDIDREIGHFQSMRDALHHLVHACERGGDAGVSDHRGAQWRLIRLRHDRRSRQKPPGRRRSRARQSLSVRRAASRSFRPTRGSPPRRHGCAPGSDDPSASHRHWRSQAPAAAGGAARACNAAGPPAQGTRPDSATPVRWIRR